MKLDQADRRLAMQLEDWVIENPTDAAYEIVGLRKALASPKLLESADVLTVFQKYIPQLCGKIGLQTISQLTEALNGVVAESKPPFTRVL